MERQCCKNSSKSMNSRSNNKLYLCKSAYLHFEDEGPAVTVQPSPCRTSFPEPASVGQFSPKNEKQHMSDIFETVALKNSYCSENCCNRRGGGRGEGGCMHQALTNDPSNDIRSQLFETHRDKHKTMHTPAITGVGLEDEQQRERKTAEAVCEVCVQVVQAAPAGLLFSNNFLVDCTGCA